MTCSRLAKELKTEQEAEEGSSESTNSEEKSTDTTEKKVKDEEVSFLWKILGYRSHCEQAWAKSLEGLEISKMTHLRWLKENRDCVATNSEVEHI